MNLSATLDRLHAQVTHNRWLRYFTVFVRVALAAGFLPSGYVKIAGERFTSLAVNHPMGNYLEALHHTGYYYTFIGIAQMTAAVLLLIPRTVLLGALLYFPIILNICILSLAVRFEGSLVTSPLMVLANFYLLCWHYDRLKLIVAPVHPARAAATQTALSSRFPIGFLGGVFATMVLVVLTVTTIYELMPRNTLSDCQRQCPDSSNPAACEQFCDCIHNQGKSLSHCLDAFNRANALVGQAK